MPSSSPSSTRGWERGEKAGAAAPGNHVLPVTRPQVARVLRELLPRRRWTHTDLRRWLTETCCRNARAKASHAKRRQLMLHKLSL